MENIWLEILEILKNFLPENWVDLVIKIGFIITFILSLVQHHKIKNIKTDIKTDNKSEDTKMAYQNNMTELVQAINTAYANSLGINNPPSIQQEINAICDWVNTKTFTSFSLKSVTAQTGGLTTFTFEFVHPNGQTYVESFDVNIPTVKGDKGDTGATGATGATGRGIVTMASGTPVEEDGFTVTPITTVYTDGTSPSSFNVKAKNGTDGKDGKEITSFQTDPPMVVDDYTQTEVVVNFNNNQSNVFSVMAKNGKEITAFQTEPPMQVDGYTQTEVIVRYNDNTSYVFGIVAKNGENGTNGADGKSVTSMTSGNPVADPEKTGYTATPVTALFSDGTGNTFKVYAKDGENGGSTGNAIYPHLVRVSDDGQDDYIFNFSFIIYSNVSRVLTSQEVYQYLLSIIDVVLVARHTGYPVAGNVWDMDTSKIIGTIESMGINDNGELAIAYIANNQRFFLPLLQNNFSDTPLQILTV